MVEDIRRELEISNKWHDFEQHGGGINSGRNKTVFGTVFESLVIDFLIPKNTSQRLKICSGLIQSDDGNKFSPQVDIVIASSLSYPPSGYEPFHKFGIVPKNSVKAIIECKSYLDKPTFNNVKNYFAEISHYLPVGAKKLLVIGTLYTPIPQEKLKEYFNFCDDFFILWRKEGQWIEDYGHRHNNFVNTLKQL